MPAKKKKTAAANGDIFSKTDVESLKKAFMTHIE